jgi:Arc/MetJ family transcription regulator
VRTTIDISDVLYNSLSRAYKIKSKTALVNLALEELNRKKAMEDFINNSSKIRLNMKKEDLDIARSR